MKNYKINLTSFFRMSHSFKLIRKISSSTILTTKILMTKDLKSDFASLTP